MKTEEEYKQMEYREFKHQLACCDTHLCSATESKGKVGELAKQKLLCTLSLV